MQIFSNGLIIINRLPVRKKPNKNDIFPGEIPVSDEHIEEISRQKKPRIKAPWQRQKLPATEPKIFFI